MEIWQYTDAHTTFSLSTVGCDVRMHAKSQWESESDYGSGQDSHQQAAGGWGWGRKHLNCSEQECNHSSFGSAEERCRGRGVTQHTTGRPTLLLMVLALLLMMLSFRESGVHNYPRLPNRGDRTR